MNKSVIYEVTTAHPRDDIRIYQKYCKSLSKDFQVELIVQDGLGDESQLDSLVVRDLGSKSVFGHFGRYYKIFKYLKKNNNKSNSLIHMHDPELMPLAILLGLCNYNVVFDFHEDYVKQLESKPYLNALQKHFFRIIFRPLMFLTCKFSKLTVGVTPQIVRKLSGYKDSSLLVENYPILNDVSDCKDKDQRKFVYAGNISEIRGIFEMLEFLVHLEGEFRLVLCGKFRNESLEKEVRKHPGWRFVDYEGVVDRDRLNSIFSECAAGLIFFKKVPNNLDSRPNKFYEYMEASLPIVASDIPNWQTFIDKNKCGFTLVTEDFSQNSSLKQLLSDERKMTSLGENGRRFIEKNYSWQHKYSDIQKRFQSIL